MARASRCSAEGRVTPSITMRAWCARLLALFAAAMLTMPATAFAEIVYRCRMTGSIGPKCCCSRAFAAKPAPCAPEVDRPDCCEAQRQDASATAGTSSERVPSVGAAVLSLTLTIRELIALGGRDGLAATHLARGPPPIGPPAYIENCSLLR